MLATFDRFKKRRYMVPLWGALLVLAVLASTNGASAGVPAGIPSDRVSQVGTTDTAKSKPSDGFDKLPRGMRARSMSSLVNMGLVRPVETTNLQPVKGLPPYRNRPNVAIAWQAPIKMSNQIGTNYGANEPGASMHPHNPLLALAGGNTYEPQPTHGNVENSLDGGQTWNSQTVPSCSRYGDGVPVWLAASINDGNSAIYTTLCPDKSGARLNMNRSTDQGRTWLLDDVSNVNVDGYFNDREYLYTDNNPSSPFYGRSYITIALFDPGGSGSWNTVGARASTDGGINWTPFVAVVAGDEFRLGTNHNEFPSLAIQPSGAVVEAWHRGSCCGAINVPNKVMWTRSTDGGVSFPISGTVVTVPLNETISFNSSSPAGFRWNDTPNITADPVDGTLYATWIQRRAPDDDTTAAVYMSTSMNDGTDWSTPVIVDNSHPHKFQYMQWAEVSRDHVVHVTYGAAAPGGSTDQELTQFYVQSTDQGKTFSAPFQLSDNVYLASGFMGDYQAISVGGDSGGGYSIFTTWTETSSGENRWGRIGRVTVGTPTVTPTGTPPTPTQTRTRTDTATRTNTPTATATICGGGQYVISQSTGSIVPGTADVGNHCDDCNTYVPLPFSYRLYDRDFTAAWVSSNGNMQFISNLAAGNNVCLPFSGLNYAILPHWDDLRTDLDGNYGVFTSVTGIAPNRIFNVEWRAALANRRGDVDFEARLYEGQTRFDFVYGAVTQFGTGATIGVQHRTGTNYTQFSCNTGGIGDGVVLSFTLPPCGTLTSTPTGTLPTATRTPTATPTFCLGNYSYATATATIQPGTSDIGLNCDDCTTNIPFPFPVSFYGQSFSAADISSNGNLQFTTSSEAPFNVCLPEPSLDAAVLPNWDDLRTDDNSGCPAGGCGVFTSVSGSAPNRVFNIEWRAVRYSNPIAPVNFEVRFYENRQMIDFVYGQLDGGGGDATIGMQNDANRFNEYACLVPNSLRQGLLIRWTLEGCSAFTPTNTPTQCPTCTATRTPTITTTSTITRTPTSTPCGQQTFVGSISLTDPQQMGRSFRDGVRSLCDVPKSCPDVVDGALRHYDSYTFTNSNPVTECVTVNLRTLCHDIHDIFAVAYLDSFDPQHLCSNYLADMGSSPFPQEYMSFQVPPGRNVVVVISEVTTNEGCPEYTLTVQGIGLCGTPTVTPTGTAPTATVTPTRTATPCGYNFATATATIVPGTVDIGNHCDDCSNFIVLPFPFRLYDTQYNGTTVSSNGNLQFITTSASRFNTCLPNPVLSAALIPYWTDLLTDCANCGVFSSTTGVAPNRVFNVEWRAGYFKGTGTANFEVRLYESTNIFDFVYGSMAEEGFNATVGVQYPGATAFNQYECNSGGLTQGLLVRGVRQVCGSPTATYTITRTPTRGTPSPTPSPSPTSMCPPVTIDVGIQGFAFTPNLLSIFPGTTVRWTNFDSTNHTSTSNDGSWDSGIISPTLTYSRRFDTAGTFLYHCAIHSFMTASIVVLVGCPPTNTPTITRTGVATATPTITRTNTPTVISTTTPTFTATGPARPTDTNTRTPTSTNTPSPTRTPTLGTPSPSPTSICPPLYADIAIQNFAFTPSPLTVYQGTTVRWMNLDVAMHTSTGDGGTWNSGVIPTGWTYERRFDIVGTFTYHCAIHPFVAGTIVVLAGCPPTNTPTITRTGVATATPTITRTNTNTPSITPTGPPPTNSLTPAITPTSTATSCSMPFTDVHTQDYFYVPARWLYCRGAISGYSDGTFRPYNNTTRGQMAKIVVLAYGLATYTPPAPTFRDVPPTQTFYQYIETIAHNLIVSGYDCGGPGEPCPGVYYRPVNLITRGQLSKIIVLTARWVVLNPVGATFNDVPPGSVFYTYVETAFCHLVVSGYACGGAGEPCPGLYFRVNNNATRGQIAKMVYNAVSNLGCR
jgi:plastocyanin